MNARKEGYQSESGVWSRKAVEKAVDERLPEKDSFRQERLVAFFGLGKGVSLTDNEKREFMLFSRHAMKRLARAPGRFHDAASPREVLAKITPDHDIAHAITAYALSDEKSVIPAFAYASAEGDLEPSLLREEIMTCLWGGSEYCFVHLVKNGYPQGMKEDLGGDMKNIGIDDATILTLLDPLSDRHVGDFGDALRLHERLTGTNVLVDKIQQIRDANDGVIAVTDIDALMMRLNASLAAIASNRAPAYIATAKRIYEGAASDPKILVHEFERICGPLLDRLKTIDAKIVMEKQSVSNAHDAQAAHSSAIAEANELKMRLAGEE